MIFHTLEQVRKEYYPAEQALYIKEQNDWVEVSVGLAPEYLIVGEEDDCKVLLRDIMQIHVEESEVAEEQQENKDFSHCLVVCFFGRKGERMSDKLLSMASSAYDMLSVASSMSSRSSRTGSSLLNHDVKNDNIAIKPIQRRRRNLSQMKLYSNDVQFLQDLRTRILIYADVVQIRNPETLQIPNILCIVDNAERKRFARKFVPVLVASKCTWSVVSASASLTQITRLAKDVTTIVQIGGNDLLFVQLDKVARQVNSRLVVGAARSSLEGKRNCTLVSHLIRKFHEDHNEACNLKNTAFLICRGQGLLLPHSNNTSSSLI